MSASARRLALVAALAFAASGVAGRQPPELIVHEWGTFTTVAGEEGQAVEWLPLGGPQDLPCFVYPFENNNLVKYWGGVNEPPLTYDKARFAMRGTVRMETPVVYFYAPEPVWADVTVSFPQGLMTEWYPHAWVAQPPATAGVLRRTTNSVLRWKDVAIRPNSRPALPTEQAASHYYAARETDAAAIRVGEEDEKFLFYRGVAGFQPPLTATVTADGVRLKAAGDHPIDGVVLFENRRGRIGYRVHGTLRGEATVAAPALTGDLRALHRDLERMLIASGLYAKEARAMIETWRDSWFEEGTRVFYLVPTSVVDAILPLEIAPTPVEVVRTFVGRMEVFTPAALLTLGDAIAEGDDATVIAWGRFLDPMTERILSRARPADRARIVDRVNATYRAHLEAAAIRCQ
jgi:hypothetical protein